MLKSKIKMLQLAVTLAACAFLFVPTCIVDHGRADGELFQRHFFGVNPEMGLPSLGALCR